MSKLQKFQELLGGAVDVVGKALTSMERVSALMNGYSLDKSTGILKMALPVNEWLASRVAGLVRLDGSKPPS
jgi:hypothetical protein